MKSARGRPPDSDPADRPPDTCLGGAGPNDSWPEGAWDVPLELVLAAPTSSVLQALVRRRLKDDDWPQGTARVFRRGKRFFAEVFYGPMRNSVVFPLDVHPVENGLGRERAGAR